MLWYLKIVKHIIENSLYFKFFKINLKYFLNKFYDIVNPEMKICF